MTELIYAQVAESSPLVSFLPLVFIFIIFYFLLIRPNSKKQKVLNQKRSEMKKGDKVLIAGGIYAKVVKIKENDGIAIVQIAPQVEIEILISSVVDVLDTHDKVEKNKSTK